MTVLAPMRQEVYPAYLQSSVADYADDNVAAGRWPAQGCVERSLAEFETLAMSLELSTIGQHVFGHNPGAQALYAKLGYMVTGINMQKQVSATEGHL